MAALIPVSCFFTLGPINCSNKTKLLAVILVKFLKGVQPSILTSARMLNLLFSLFRKFDVQLFLLCPAIAADRRAVEDIFPHTTEYAFQSRAKTGHGA